MVTFCSSTEVSIFFVPFTKRMLPLILCSQLWQCICGDINKKPKAPKMSFSYYILAHYSGYCVYPKSVIRAYGYLQRI